VRLLLIGIALALLGAPGPVPAAPPAQDCVVLDDFSAGPVGEFPPDWKPRKPEGKGVYSIREEGGRRFLHAASRGLGIQAGRDVTWDLAAYPVLAWSWRTVQFPAGADERHSDTNDSALAVYAAFPHSPVSLRALKYIWSAVVPVGTHLTSNMTLTQVRVLRNGAARRGTWVAERVNVLEDYRRYFDADAPRPEGIAVLTDADDTKSAAQGDYANFRACKG
jgi:hypothetical protein